MNDEEITNKEYSVKGGIHPQPCRWCGSVECAICMEEVRELMALARKDEREKAMKAYQKHNQHITLECEVKSC
jgi:hypothetical protein